MPRTAAALQIGYAIAACLLLVFGRISAPPARVGEAPAAAIGLALAVLLHAALARDREPPERRLLLPSLGAAASEEVVWRWGLLAGVAPLFGWGGAFALSTVGFAYRHTRAAGLPSYLALGAAFGGVFLGTGRLAAAIAAHAGYNALALVRGGR